MECSKCGASVDRLLQRNGSSLYVCDCCGHIQNNKEQSNDEEYEYDRKY